MNFHRDDQLVTLTREPGMASPVSIVIQSLDLKAVQSLQILENSIKINHDEIPLPKEKMYDSNLALKQWDPGRISERLAALKKRYLIMAPDLSLAFVLDPDRSFRFQGPLELGLAKQALDGVRIMQNGRLLDGLKALKGLGFGLTPGGDDFIAGVLAGLRVLEPVSRIDTLPLRQAILRMAMGANLISNTCIRLAGRGWFHQNLKLFVEAFFTASLMEGTKKMKQLMTWGSTSGADTLAGLFFVLSEKQIFQNWSRS